MYTPALVLILDGLGDRPCPQLGGLTPLQSAHTPTLDRIAAQHQSGMMDPLKPGVTVETHTGVGMLLGVHPDDAPNLRRGPVEAAGIGLALQPGDLLWRANFASVSKTANGYAINDRRAGRIATRLNELCADFQELEVAPGIHASLHPATQHRAVLRLRGKNLSAQVSDTDPGGRAVARGVLTAKPLQTSDVAASSTAAAVNAFTQRAYEILQNHEVNVARIRAGQAPANAVLLRSPGQHRRLDNLLVQLRLRVAVVAGERTILGLGALFGFERVYDARFTSLPDTDLDEKLRQGIAQLARHDLVFIHIKGTDTTAHDKNPKAKAEFIARIDRALAQHDLQNFVFAVCADHSTDSISGEHSSDPVPVLLSQPGGRRDAVTHYHETACVGGGLGRTTAHEFLRHILGAMGVES